MFQFNHQLFNPILMLLGEGSHTIRPSKSLCMLESVRLIRKKEKNIPTIINMSLLFLGLFFFNLKQSYIEV